MNESDFITFLIFTWITGLAMWYNTNDMLITIPMIIPNSMEYRTQATNVHINGMISTPKKSVQKALYSEFQIVSHHLDE